MMERGVTEIAQGRSVIEQQKAQLADYEDALQKAEKLDSSNSVLINFLKAEITKIREALGEKQTALDAKQKEVDIYKAELAKTIKKKNFFKKIAKFTSISTVALAAAAFILLKQ